MLELPELETVCGGLSCLIGKHIKQAEIDELRTNVRSFYPNVADKRIYYLFRSGRFIIFGLRKKSSTSFLVLSPTPLSRIIIYINNYRADDLVHRVALLKLNDFLLSITDESHETTLNYFPDHKSLRTFLQKNGATGKDPMKLVKPETFMRLADKFKSNTLTIEGFLRSDCILQGIGPYLASEILHDADIHPSSLTGKMEHAHWQSMHASMQDIINKSIKDRGNSIYGYVDAFGNTGLYQGNLKVFANPEASITEMGTYYFPSQNLIL